MNIFTKPPKWVEFNFAEKLKWYAKKDNKLKNQYADKYNIKDILHQLKLPGLKYAKVIDYVKPIYTDDLNNYDVLVSADHLLKERKYHIADWRLSKIEEITQTKGQMWKVAKDKYQIVKNDEKNKPPQFYVLKLNLGWNTMIFFKNNEILKCVSGSREFRCDLEILPRWKKHTLNKYTKKIPAKFFIEEFLGFNLKVYEVYCIYGKPIILSIYYETDTSYENNYLIKSLPAKDQFSYSLLEDKQLIPGSVNVDINLDNDLCNNVCKFAKTFASKFEFIRVDFYYSKGDIYFSECTFKPGALKKIKWKDIGVLLSKEWTKEKPKIK